MSETLTKLGNLSKTVTTSAQIVLGGHSQSCRIGIENNKNLVEIKPVLVVKHVEILPFIFNFRQSRTHIRQCGHWAVNISYCRKFIKVSLCQKLQKLVDI